MSPPAAGASCGAASGLQAGGGRALCGKATPGWHAGVGTRHAAPCRRRISSHRQPEQKLDGQ